MTLYREKERSKTIYTRQIVLECNSDTLPLLFQRVVEWKEIERYTEGEVKQWKGKSESEEKQWKGKSEKEEKQWKGKRVRVLGYSERQKRGDIEQERRSEYEIKQSGVQ